jgi:menaquinone-dependent protoporphyrinogen IX oxidase
MRDVPVFYATTEGQTRRIAERIAADLQARGLPGAAGDAHAHPMARSGGL